MITEIDFMNMWDQFRTIIEEESRNFDRKWILRKRRIDTNFLVLFIFQLVLSKNKQGYGTTLSLLWKNCSEADIPLPSLTPLAASSVCEARQKLSDKIFVNIQNKIIKCWEENYDQHFLWLGHRIFTVDGSKFNLPRELTEVGYDTPSDNAYYPQGLLSCLYRAGCALPYAWDFASHANERASCSKLLENLGREEILILDRGYYSFELLSECKARGIIPVFRLSSLQLKNERKDREGNDYKITVLPTKKLIKKVKSNGLEISLDPIEVRIVNYRAGDTDISLATLLLDEKYSQANIAKLYWARWGEEELYKVSKSIIDVEDFHSKTELGVKQEISAHFVLITISRIAAIKTEIELNFEAQSQTNSASSTDKRVDSGNPIATSGTDKNVVNSKAGMPPLSIGVIKINFKAAISLLSNILENLVMSVSGGFQRVFNEYLEAIKKLIYKFRPLRSFPRRSRKPLGKWRPSKA